MRVDSKRRETEGSRENAWSSRAWIAPGRWRRQAATSPCSLGRSAFRDAGAGVTCSRTEASRFAKLSADRSSPEAEFETIDNPITIYSGSGLHAVTVAPSGYEPGEVEAEVEPTEDGCHVVTQELELVLETDAG